MQRWFDAGCSGDPRCDAPEVSESLLAFAALGTLRIAEAASRGVLPLQRYEAEVDLDPNDPRRLLAVARDRNDVERWNEQVSLLCNMEGAKMLQRRSATRRGRAGGVSAPPPLDGWRSWRRSSARWPSAGALGPLALAERGATTSRPDGAAWGELTARFPRRCSGRSGTPIGRRSFRRGAGRTTRWGSTGTGDVGADEGGRWGVLRTRSRRRACWWRCGRARRTSSPERR
nr:hypothetical protein [Deltaproteobacteria bacterium]